MNACFLDLELPKIEIPEFYHTVMALYHQRHRKNDLYTIYHFANLLKNTRLCKILSFSISHFNMRFSAQDICFKVGNDKCRSSNIDINA